MSSKVSFEGIGQVLATFYAADGVEAGQVVKLSGDSTVAPCAAGDRFFGVAVNAREGCAGVQADGYVEVPCQDSSVTVGYVALSADGSGGVKKAAGTGGDVGEEHLVVSKDSAGTITIKM